MKFVIMNLIVILLQNILTVIIFLLEWGDIIDNINDKYRNDPLFMWNGEKAVLLCTDIDDYGLVPNEFIVSKDEFSPNYWENVISHNNYYWPSIEYRKDICNSLVFYDELTS